MKIQMRHLWLFSKHDVHFHSIFAIQLIQSTTKGKGKKNNDGLVESSYN